MPGFGKVEHLTEGENHTQYPLAIRFNSQEMTPDLRNSGAHRILKPKIKAQYDGSNLKVNEVIA